MIEGRTDFVVRRFIPALRSGRFEQITSVLCGGQNKRCAEGVAINAALEMGALPGAGWVAGGVTYYLKYAGHAYDRSMPLTVTKLLGNIAFVDPRYGTVNFSLASANDSGLSFRDLADALAKPPPTKEEIQADWDRRRTASEGA